MFKNRTFYLQLFGIIGVCITSSLLCSWSICEGHDWGDDFALYIEQAQCLISDCSSQLVADNKFSADNSDVIAGPYLYPVGFPALLSMVLAYSGINFILLKAFCAAFFILSIPIIYLVFKPLIKNDFLSIIHIMLIGLNPVYILFSNYVLSDLPFLFFFYLSLLLISLKNKNTLYYLLVGLTIAISALIRDLGILLLPAFILKEIISGEFSGQKWKYYILWFIKISSTIAIFLVGFQINRLYSGSPGGLLNSILSHITWQYSLGNFVFYSNCFVNLFLAGNIGGCLILAFACFGLALNLWGLIKSHLLIIFVFCTYLFIHIIWPYRDLRFIFPIVPIFLFFVITGIQGSLEFLLKQNYNAAYGCFIVAFLILSIKDIRAKNSSCINEVLTKEISEVYNYIKANTSKKAIIVFDKPRALRLFTGRNSINKSDLMAIPSSIPKYVLRNRKDTLIGANYNTEFCNEEYCLYKMSY